MGERAELKMRECWVTMYKTGNTAIGVVKIIREEDIQEEGEVS